MVLHPPAQAPAYHRLPVQGGPRRPPGRLHRPLERPRPSLQLVHQVRRQSHGRLPCRRHPRP